MKQQSKPATPLESRWPVRVRYGKAMLSAVVLWGLTAPALGHASELFPIPDAVRPNVYFWKKVFAEIDVSGGILHDINDISVIYETLQELPGNSQERQSAMSGYRDYYQTILLTLAAGKRVDLSYDEARVLAMFKGNDSPAVLSTAAANMRFQGGMREKFMRGIIRSGAYQPDIERIFVAAGLPTELAYLPHVESSFENRALSKVGAAGIWQIMPATGRRFLTVNGRVDERLNVQAATTAAARIFQENYEQLGTWPLAITAYNHGLYGMKQAVETMGTTDFGIIFQYYRGPAFGFASQNFYAEFVAALDVARNYKRYFGDIYFDPPVSFSTMARQQRDNERSTEPTPPVVLSAVSPPLRETPAPEPDKYAPKPATSGVIRQAKDTSSHDHQAALEPGRTYRVQPGDTLLAIARQFRTTPAQLSALNNISPRYMVKTGETLAIAASIPLVAEKTPPRIVAKATGNDTVRQSVVDTAVKKAVDDVTPKAVASKTVLATPPQPPPAKPTILRVATASSAQRTVVKIAAAEPANPSRTSITKTTGAKAVPPETAKPGVASPTKTAAAKLVTKGGPLETSRSAGVSTTKVVVTKPQGPREEPKVTPVSTRTPTRRSNSRGA